MVRPKIDEIARLMDRAFATSEHSLLKNLATVREESWTAVPPGGERSIREITRHVGLFKYIYANHAFKRADLDYSDPPANPPLERLTTPANTVAWLREAHEYLMQCIRELADDSELEAPRKAHWGDCLGVAPV